MTNPAKPAVKPAAPAPTPAAPAPTPAAPASEAPAVNLVDSVEAVTPIGSEPNLEGRTVMQCTGGITVIL